MLKFGMIENLVFFLGIIFLKIFHEIFSCLSNLIPTRFYVKSIFEAVSEALNFVLDQFRPTKIAKTSDPQLYQNGNFWNFWNSKNRFHVKSGWQSTVWKFRDFSVTQILHEIIFA